MKKVLFFAAILAVASMTFVACGNKQENKEGEKTEQKAEGAKEEGAKEEGNDAKCAKEEKCEKVECCKIDRVEEAVRAVEAATTIEEIIAIEQEYSDLTDESFTEEQQARIEKAFERIMHLDAEAEEVQTDEVHGEDLPLRQGGG